MEGKPRSLYVPLAPVHPPLSLHLSLHLHLLPQAKAGCSHRGARSVLITGKKKGGDWRVKGIEKRTLTKDSISQETQQNKDTTFCLFCYWQNAGKCSTSHGQSLRVVTENRLHNSWVTAYNIEKEYFMAVGFKIRQLMAGKKQKGRERKGKGSGQVCSTVGCGLHSQLQ